MVRIRRDGAYNRRNAKHLNGLLALSTTRNAARQFGVSRFRVWYWRNKVRHVLGSPCREPWGLRAGIHTTVVMISVSLFADRPRTRSSTRTRGVVAETLRLVRWTSSLPRRSSFASTSATRPPRRSTSSRHCESLGQHLSEWASTGSIVRYADIRGLSRRRQNGTC